MKDRRSGWVAALTLLLVAAAGGCATTKAERCEVDAEPVEAPQAMAGDPRPAEAWLWPEDAALRVKMDPRGWTPLATAVAGLVDGLEPDALPPASVVLQHVVPPPALAEVDHARPAWLVVSAGSERLLRACLGAGLPCTRQAWETPVYARLLLPAHDPAALAATLRETVAWTSRVVRHRGFVRLELAVGVQGEPPAVDAELNARAAGLRDEAGAGPDTPARRAFSEHDGLLAVHGELGRMLSLAQHVGARSVGPTLAQVPPRRVVDALAQGTWILNRAKALDGPARAEVGDAALLVGLAGDVPALDVVGSRTPFGRRVAEAARFTPEMTPFRVGAPIVSLDWAMDAEPVAAAGAVPEWMDEGPESLWALFHPLGAWMAPGLARHPLGVVAALLEPPMAEASGEGPPALLALRVRAEPRQAPAPSDDIAAEGEADGDEPTLLRGGAALLFAGGERTEALLTALRLQLAGDSRYDLDVRTRGDRAEVLVSYGAPVAEVFGDAPAAVDWTAQGLRLDLDHLAAHPDYGRLLVERFRVWPFAGGRLPARLPHAPVVLSLAGDEATARLRLTLGDAGEPPAPAAGAPVEQPEVTCLDLLYRELAPIVDAAAHGRQASDVLRVGLDGVRATLDARVAQCRAGDREAARLAVAHVDWLRARLAARAGDPEAAEELDRKACEAGHCPSCEDPEAAWPGAVTTEARSGR